MDDEVLAEEEPITVRVPTDWHGARLDATAASLFPQFSRSRLAEWIKDGRLLRNQLRAKPRDKVVVDDELYLDPGPEDRVEWGPEDLPLDVLYEDEHVVVINKPAGLVVHPGAGNADGTLVNALLAKFPEVRALPRAGIVHRLDKDTTGIMVAARSELAHQHLVAALAAREVRREYFAIVRGVPTAGATIDAPIGRHPRVRTRMAVVGGGRPALTTFRVAEKFAHFAALRVRLSTGRTHQIRVHALEGLGAAVTGDPVYGTAHPGGMMLHAIALTVPRPGKEDVTAQAPWPERFTALGFDGDA